MQRTAHCVPTRVLIALPSWARGVAIVPCRTVATWHSLECPPGALRRQGSYTLSLGTALNLAAPPPLAPPLLSVAKTWQPAHFTRGP